MTFFKNLWVVITGLAIALLAAWVVGLPLLWIIYGLTFYIPAAVFILYLEDLFRKARTDKNLLSAQYYFGGVILFAAIASWFWASMSVTALEQGVRLGVTFLFSVLVGLWFNKAYKRSLQTEEERELEQIERYEAREQKKWGKLREKIYKKDKEEAVELLSTHLAFHLTGDSLNGDLDFNVPLALVDETPLTYNQLIGTIGEDGDAIASLRNAAYQYIQTLVLGKDI